MPPDLLTIFRPEILGQTDQSVTEAVYDLQCTAVFVEYRRYISAPGVCQCLVVQTPIDNMSKENKPNTSITHVACDSKLRLVVRSSMHSCSRR